MTELPPQLRQVRDFFFKQALALSPERTYLHQPELIKNQTIFRLEDLRKHLNNPFLDLDFVQIIDRGQLVDLRAARCFKVVQRRQIEFVNRLVLQKHLENGAACLLEGVDILEPQVNLLAACLDRAHSYCSCAAARRTRSRRSATIPCTFPLTSATVPWASKPCSIYCSSVTTAIPCGRTAPHATCSKK